MGAMKENSTSMEKLIQYFEQSADTTRGYRQLAERDRDFYDGKQWTPEETEELTRRGQTPVTVNKVAGKIDWMLGMERQLRADPVALSRTIKHEGAANAATDALRYVADSQNFDDVSSECAESGFVEGIEIGIVEAKQKGDQIDVTVKQVKWDRFFFDPHRRRKDYRDCRYLGFVIWMDMEEVKQKWPKSADQIDAGMAANLSDDTYEDKPETMWYDAKRKRVMVVQMYYIDKGQWNQAIFCKGAFLAGPIVSPYLDEDGLPECPLVVRSAKLDRDGNPIGAARVYIDPQREVNARRSKFLFLLSQRQTLGEQGAVDDVSAMKKELAKADGHVVVNANQRFEFVPNGDMANGQFQLYQSALAEIDGMGANPALQGKQEGDTSGYALERRERGGLMEMGPFFDSHRMWKRDIYRAVWNRIRQFWKEEKWIRVTDDEESLKWVGLNAKVSQAEQMIMDASGMPLDQIKKEFQDDIEQVIAARPDMGAPVDTQNDVAELDVDIIIDETADAANIQSQQFEQLVQLYSANPQGIPWESIIKASSLRDKRAILAASQGDPEQAAAMAQKQQEIEQTAMEQAQAEIERLRSQSAKDMASTQKIAAETQQIQLETQVVAAFPDVRPNVNV